MNWKWKLRSLTLLILSLGTTGILFTGCGDDSGSSSSTSSTSSGSVSDVDDLPAATEPVTSDSGAIFKKALFRKSLNRTKAATEGVVLFNADSLSWSASTSRPLCETVSMVKDLFSEAANPDKILCYIGAMKAGNAFEGTLDDGNFKYFSVDQGGETGYVKFKIVKNAAGGIAQFQMYSCMDNGSTQDSYINQTIANNEVNLITKNRGSDGGNTFAGSITATGDINSSGQWLSKTITGTKYFSDGSSTFGSYGQIIQGATSLTLTGYMKGNFSSGPETQTFSNGFYSKAQILGADSVPTFAIGDGSSKYSISWSSSGGGSFSQSQTDSWDGDDRTPLLTASEGDHYSAANAGTVPTPEDVAAITYSTGESWDCKDADGGTSGFTASEITESIQTALTACDTKFGSDRTWVNCSDAR